MTISLLKVMLIIIIVTIIMMMMTSPMSKRTPVTDLFTFTILV